MSESQQTELLRAWGEAFLAFYKAFPSPPPEIEQRYQELDQQCRRVFNGN